jgi:hypothetical protein
VAKAEKRGPKSRRAGPDDSKQAQVEAAETLSDAEKQELKAVHDRMRTRPRAPRIEVLSVRGEPLRIGQPSKIDSARLMTVFGTAEPAFVDLMLSGLLNTACDGGPSNPPSEQDINRALAAVTGIGARDETEAMLATQMVATHFAAITLLRRLKGAENIPQQDSAGSLAVKLLRTYTAQVEALQRYRGKGQQRVTVEHVHVHQGGQAIVGTVQGGGASNKAEGQPHAPRAIAHEPSTPLPGDIKAVGETVPSTCS